MNVAESERMAGQLKKIGYELTENFSDADLILINTCCVRGAAEDKVFGKIGELKKYKMQKPDLILGVTGCLAQKEGENLARRFSQVDFVLGTGRRGELVEVVKNLESARKQFVDVSNVNSMIDDENIFPIRGGSVSAFVPIMYGCNNFCTYCIVPYVRGRERSRLPEEIFAEIKDAINSGFKEITLLGQNVNSYGLDGSGGVSFPKLLETIANFEGDFEVRFMTSHPKDLSDDLIRVMASNPKISKALHLPAQSGSNSILKAMNRNYTIEDYLAKIQKIKEAIPQITLSTDIIVGFPNETEEDYQKTVDLIKKVRYHNAFIFMYSKRKGTIAEKLENQVPIEIKHKRINDLLAIQHQISNELFLEFIGKSIKVLVEDETSEFFVAKAQCGKVVKLEKSSKISVGQFVEVKIEKYESGDLIGRTI